MNDNFAKIIAIAIVGGVAKALFGPVRSVSVGSPSLPKPENRPSLFEVKDEE